ncbi:MAG TPA: hypothetical protein VKV40_18560 [Ktedonobacteraceae bacterium]|nr:hypothetical protein [Ktedonobacteraceae bacterium]
MQGFPDAAVFEAWLRAKGGQMVGNAGSCRACPLALFLDETVGGTWCVGALLFWQEGTQCFGSLPAWARRFMAAVDAVECLDGADCAVSGYQARTLLALALADAEERLLF